MKCNMEENFSMEWNMEWKIFSMEWKKITIMEYGKIVFHSMPWLQAPNNNKKLVCLSLTIFWYCSLISRS